jgi:adenylate cyclase class 2
LATLSKEIEAKIRLDDPGSLRGRLRESGAVREAHVHETSRIFDTRERRLQAADCGLRLRECRLLDDGSPPPPTLTFKGPREPGAIKSRAELETAVADAVVLAGILHRLGFQEVVEYEKRRETWRLGECMVCLDELPQLGWFAEVEGPSTQAVGETMTRLALAGCTPLGETYVELAAAHGSAAPSGCRRLMFQP